MLPLHKILRLTLISATLVLSVTTSFAKEKKRPEWANETFRQMNALSKDASKDIKEFIKENPDWVADAFGGTIYDRKEAFKAIVRDPIHAIDVGINDLKKNLGLNYEPSDGLTNLCTSPRICLGMQYITAKSILENMSKYPDLEFYMGSTGDEKHNFIVMIPKGIEKTQENMEKFSIIFDPYPSQSGEIDQFLHFGFEPLYKGMSFMPLINQDSLDLVFGKNPFGSPTPTPDPDPTPTPDVCAGGIYKTNPDGTAVMAQAADGKYYPVAGSPLVWALFVAASPQGTVSASMGYTLTTQCDWNAHPEYLQQALATVNPATGFNCIGIYNMAPGTLIGTSLPKTGFSSIHCP